MCGVWNHFHNAIHPKIHDIVVKIHPKVEKSPEDVESIFHSSLEYYSGLTYNDFTFTRFQCNLKSFGWPEKCQLLSQQIDFYNSVCNDGNFFNTALYNE